MVSASATERVVRMKVFVSVDMEGVAGLVQWDAAQRDLQCRLMTEEVNAAARGAFAAGASEVLAGESHNNMRFLLPELLDPRVEFLTGQPKPMNHMGGLDGSFGLAMFLGCHAKAGTWRGVMSNTFANLVAAREPRPRWRRGRTATVGYISCLVQVSSPSSCGSAVQSAPGSACGAA